MTEIIAGNSNARYAGSGDAPRVLLRRYAELLSSCVTVRLTGTRGVDELYERHVLDCLNSVPFLPDSGPVIDVGSGGGLPGIVWAVCRPDLNVVLLDSIGKKCRAVSGIVKELGVTNVEVLCGRSEDIAKERRETFSLACARAVASAGVTAELLSPLVRVGGTVMTFKGAKLSEELEGITGWKRLGLKKPVTHFYGSDEDGEPSSRSIVLWEKIAPCPRSFPRKPGLAAVKNWWM